MFALLRGLLESAVETDEIKILLIGLSGSGKSTFLQKAIQINENDAIATEAVALLDSCRPNGDAPQTQPKCFPTVGLNAERISFRSKTLLFWDVGGHESMRHSWTQYLKEASVILFFVDFLEIDNHEGDWKSILPIEHVRNTPIGLILSKYAFQEPIFTDSDVDKLASSIFRNTKKAPIFKLNSFSEKGISKILNWCVDVSTVESYTTPEIVDL